MAQKKAELLHTYAVPFGSLVVCAILLGMVFGMWFGIALVTMLLVHEMGHVSVAKLRGIDVALPIFIPFLGAVILMPPQKERSEEAWFAFGGPFVGGLVSLALLCLYLLIKPTGKVGEIFLQFVQIGIWLNLFNLLPMRPLDGGRILQATGTWYQWVGTLMLFYITWLTQETWALLIWIMVVGDIVSHPVRRFALGAAIFTAMFLLVFLGVSHMPPLVNLMCVIFGAFTLWTYHQKNLEYLVRKGYDAKAPIEIDDRDLPRMSVRIAWAGAYIALATALWCGMTIVHDQRWKQFVVPKSNVIQKTNVTAPVGAVFYLYSLVISGKGVDPALLLAYLI